MLSKAFQPLISCYNMLKCGDLILHPLRRKKMSSTECVDTIQEVVCEYLKPLGFHKFGRTMHRFVEEDISQVIHFQNGCPQKSVREKLWINIGIRVSEYAEKKFKISEPMKNIITNTNFD